MLKKLCVALCVAHHLQYQHSLGICEEWNFSMTSDFLDPKLSGWAPAFSCVLPRLPGESDALLM